MQHSARRVVVTGIGAVTPLGNTVLDTWQALLQGKSGVGLITDRFDITDFPTKIAGLVRNFDPTLSMDDKLARRTDTFVQYGMEASRQAVLDSGITVTDQNAHRIGVALGSGIGGLPMIEKTHDAYLEGGPRRISPFFIPGSIVNILAGLVSMQYGFKGPNISIVTACTTGAHNVGLAMRMIQYGDADVMVAGGAEMATTPLGLGGFSSMKALSRRNDEPEKASRPWDRDRDGFVLGEGAGTIVLEEYEHAKKRGAKIYAELVGFGMSGDAYHMTAPEPEGEGFVSAMNNALNDAKMNFSAIDYINAHGTSTPLGDVIEVKAVKKVFGDHAYKLAMSSTKSMTGHLLGATGTVEAIFSVLAILNGVAPATINLDNPDEGCDLNLVPHEAQSRSIDAVLSNSFGFGGTNGTLIFRRV